MSNGNGNGKKKPKGFPIDPVTGKQIRGFGLMKRVDPERLKDISARAARRAAKGLGKSVGYRWDKAEAKRQARRGGIARWGRKL